jgi:hypothetical protein
MSWICPEFGNKDELTKYNCSYEDKNAKRNEKVPTKGAKKWIVPNQLTAGRRLWQQREQIPIKRDYTWTVQSRLRVGKRI